MTHVCSHEAPPRVEGSAVCWDCGWPVDANLAFRLKDDPEEQSLAFAGGVLGVLGCIVALLFWLF